MGSNSLGIQAMIMTTAVNFLRSFVKWVLHLLTGTCELQRICFVNADQAISMRIHGGGSTFLHDMFWKFAVALYRSKQLSKERALMFPTASNHSRLSFPLVTPFNIDTVVAGIYSVKRITAAKPTSSPSAIALYPTPAAASAQPSSSGKVEEGDASISFHSNLTRCVTALNHVNAALQRLLLMTRIVYNGSCSIDESAVNSSHHGLPRNEEHSVLLCAFWDLMTTGVDRSSSILTKDGAPEPVAAPLSVMPPLRPAVTARLAVMDWTEVGFQNQCPASDLRGMGMLGLVQLVYFAAAHNQRARQVLLESRHPRRCFPMAATGINVTYFVVCTMVAERRLHNKLLGVVEEYYRHHHQQQQQQQQKKDLQPLSTSDNSNNNHMELTALKARAGSTSTGPAGVSPVPNDDSEEAEAEAGFVLIGSEKGKRRGQGGNERQHAPPGAAVTASAPADRVGSANTDSRGNENAAVLDLLSAFILMHPSVTMHTQIKRFNSGELAEAAEDNNNTNSSGAGSGSTAETIPPGLLQHCIRAINEVYCEVFEAFTAAWVAADPPSVTAFQRVFDGVKEQMLLKYPALE